jgi:hypothetical protein
VVGVGYKYYKGNSNIGIVYINGTNYSEKDYNLLASFWIVASALTFFLSIALLIAICGDRLTAKTRHILATLTLLLEFAIAVSMSITASMVSNQIEFLFRKWLYSKVKGGSSCKNATTQRTAI